MNNKKSAIALTAFLTFIITTIMYVGAFLFFPSTSEKLGGIRSSLMPESGDFSEVRNLVNQNFIDAPNEKSLEEMATKGYVAGLNDAYSAYYTKTEYSEISAELTGNYKGIGIEVSVTEDDKIIIIAAYKDAPAYKAGIKANDIITKVNGTPYPGSKLDDAVSAIREAEGEITITIERDGKAKDFKVTPTEVSIPCAESEMLEDNIGYIQLFSFSEDANEVFRTHVNTLVADGAKALIIDLRDNPGGMLPTVVDIADLLLPKGNILTIQGRNMPKEEFKSGETCIDLPLYVLINGGSASASEVLAGALKDHKRAVIIGEKSYGKGVVQTVYELDSGAALKLTTAKYYTPSGVCIDGKGITPDHEVKWEPEEGYVYSKETDVQLQKAIKLINKK